MVINYLLLQVFVIESNIILCITKVLKVSSPRTGSLEVPNASLLPLGFDVKCSGEIRTLLPGLDRDPDPDTRVRERGPKEKQEGALAQRSTMTPWWVDS